MRAWHLAALVLLIAYPASAGAQSPTASSPPSLLAPETIGEGLALALDDDDDDGDGTRDLEQEDAIPQDDLRVVIVRGPRRTTIETSSGLRLVREGTPSSGPVTLNPRDLPARIGLQGALASTAPGDQQVTVTVDGVATRIPVTVVATRFLDGDNQPIDALTETVSVSHAITNDATLPRDHGYDGVSPDSANLRIEIRDPRIEGLTASATLTSGPAGGRPMAERRIVLRRPRPGLPFRSTFVRLVGDVMDQEAPGVGDRVLRVALRDDVRIHYDPDGGDMGTSIRVGRNGAEDGEKAARRAQLRIRILRHRRGGVPAIGGDDRGAIRIARTQVRIANEIWLQCHVDFGLPGAADIRVVDPPPPSLLAIADGDGLPARGGGVIRFRANGRPFRVTTEAGAPPVQTALGIARALTRAGLSPEVTENPRSEFGAGPSADVLVRDGRGQLVTLSADGNAPLSSDARQAVAIGVVDLSDGLREFDNMTAAAGTLEERALIKALGDRDPTTIDFFIVNHFTAGTRQGEAFIEADGSAIVNTLILDRNGIRQEREAWTQSHEIGHILLDMPFHPDNVGPDRPWLLMDADSSQGLVTGPKRITVDQCHRARSRSGVGAVPTLLGRHPSGQPARNARH